MGSALSAVFGGGHARGGARGDVVVDTTEYDSSYVCKFSSVAKWWQVYFNEIKDTDKLMVIDFSASWCGPCKMIEPVFEAMAADEFIDVEFVKLDVDELPDVAKEFNVTAMPTFVLVKFGKEVERIIGAKVDKLKSKVNEHSS